MNLFSLLHHFTVMHLFQSFGQLLVLYPILSPSHFTIFPPSTVAPAPQPLL
jgi:hypothetical protein